MGAPAPYHSVTGEVKTTIPGVTIGGTFPLLAQHMKDAALIRSFRHSVGSHAQAINHVLTGGSDPTGQGSDGYSLGSMFARLRGANHPDNGMPTYVLLNSEEIDGQYRKEKSRVISGSRPGDLGTSFSPVQSLGQGSRLGEYAMRVESSRLTDRRNLLKKMDPAQAISGCHWSHGRS